MGTATGVILIAVLFSFSTHITVMLYASSHFSSPLLSQLIPLNSVASLASFFAALITLIAFAIDIALFALTKHEINNLGGVNSRTDPGPGMSSPLPLIATLRFSSFI